MTDPILNRQSSIFTINTPTRDDVFDFSDVFNFYSDAERTNTPNLMIDQSSYENSPDFLSGILPHDFNGNGQRNGEEEEHTSTAVQVDNRSRTWGYYDSSSAKSKEIDILDKVVHSGAQSSSSDLKKQDAQSFAKEKDTVTENKVENHSIILPKQDCKSDRLFREARRHNPPKRIVPFGSKLTLFESKEYFECLRAGKKICQKNQAIIDEAMANGKVVRSNNGRNLTIFGSDQYVVRKELNLIHTHKFREDQKMT